MNKLLPNKIEFFKNGYCVLRNFLTKDEVEKYSLLAKKFRKKNKTMRTAGLHNYNEFWDIIVSDRLLNVLRNLLGQNILYLYNSHIESFQADFEYGWHRDNPCRIFGKGSDWNSKANYDVIRVGFFFSSFKFNKSGVNIIPGSHKKKYQLSQLLRLIWYKTKNTKSLFLQRIRKKFIKYIGLNIETNPGDCVMFLANVHHTGIPTSELRNSLYLTYGTNNKHAKNFNNYYLKHRKFVDADRLEIDNSVHKEFKDLLEQKKIYSIPSDIKEDIEGVT